MSESRSSKKAAEPSSDHKDIDLTEEDLQKPFEEQSSVKVQPKPSKVKTEPATLELSEAEIADILSRRACKPAASGCNPDKTSTETEKIIPRKETKTFDLKVLNKDKFSMTSVLNKQRFEQLDRLLRSNDLHTLATKTRPPPISTPSNEFGYVPSMVKCINGRNKTIPADSIANYDYDLTHLETVMHIAFDKALHQSKDSWIMIQCMYSDMHKYFHGQDSHGIKAARLALDKFKINPSASLRADITLFEEVIRNVEFAAEGVILEKIKLSIVDEKFNQDTRI
jgi:hypothetical protein